MNIGIREYQPTDLSHFKNLVTEDSVQRSMAFPRPADDEAWKHYVDERQGDHSRILTILHQNEFVGFITLKGNAIPEIYQLTYCIESQWQNMGFATVAAGNVTNAETQHLTVLHYHQIVRHKSDGEVFHNETGYWMWDA